MKMKICCAKKRISGSRTAAVKVAASLLVFFGVGVLCFVLTTTSESSSHDAYTATNRRQSNGPASTYTHRSGAAATATTTTSSGTDEYDSYYDYKNNNKSIQQCGNTTTWCPNAKPPRSTNCCYAEYSPTRYGCQQQQQQQSNEQQQHGNTLNDNTCCMPGPPLPPSKTLPNCLILGDSVSIGYTPFVQNNLKDICQVQHAPWDVRDGGAGSTQLGQACLDNFLRTQHQLKVNWDLILFNFGLHDLDATTTESQELYQKQLMNITHRLLNHWHQSLEKTDTNKDGITGDGTTNHKKRMLPTLIYATTTPFMPLAQKGIMVVDKLNEIARDVMRNISAATSTEIAILDMNKLVHDHCGVIYEDCDWCRKVPCSYHYNTVGMSNQGLFASNAIREALRQPLQLLTS